jgi:predicted enzyme related to lactoylglutathione lyase
MPLDVDRSESMDAFKTQGAFSWCELMTDDPAAAAEYYGSLFGWTTETMDMGTGPYRVLKVGGEAVGGMLGKPTGAPKMPSFWGCYVTVDDIDRTAQRCVELGGKVLMPPTEIPTVGRMAVLQDPQGATLSAITYAGQG